MRLQTRLLLYFFSISLLIMIVGGLFYFQLRNLVTPLTPQSIPQSIEQLANVMSHTELLDRIQYQNLLVEKDLDNYLDAHNMLSLQRYYMNSALTDQLLSQTRQSDPAGWRAVQERYAVLSQLREALVAAAKSGVGGHATEAVSRSQAYQTASQEFAAALQQYFSPYQPSSNETAVVTVRLAAKNSYDILQKSLHITLLIFLDAVLISWILVFFSTRAIARPIHQLRSSLDNMSVDKLDAQLDPALLERQGEVGDLARSFARLFVKLQEVSVSRDVLLDEIKRHKHTEAQLAEAAARLRDLNLDLDQFAHAASHDLRLPLKAIESLAQTIEEECYPVLSMHSRQRFDLLKNRVQRLNSLIAGMLDYYRAGRAEQEAESVDLSALLAEIIEELSPSPRIRITIDTILPTLFADKARLKTVFMNLFKNAIQYSDKKQGVIAVGHEMKDLYYQFYVEDNGCGIDSEFHETIFEVFQALASRDDSVSAGTGLAVIKRIIDKNGGRIWMESTPGEGATFYFTWPVDPAVVNPKVSERN